MQQNPQNKFKKTHHENYLLTEIILEFINSNGINFCQLSLAQICFILNDTNLYVYFGWLGQ